MQNEKENKNASQEAMRADEKSATPKNMKIEAIVNLDDATSQQHFGELSTHIKLTIENAQLLAELTQGYTAWRKDTPITVRHLVNGGNEWPISEFLQQQATKKAIQEKSLTVTLDLANLEGFRELIAELHQQHLEEKAKKDAEQKAEREWEEAKSKKSAELQQIPGITSIFGSEVYYNDKKIIDISREDFLKLTPEKIFGLILEQQKTTIEKREKRIAELAKHLHALIKASDAGTLIRAGLADAPSPDYEEEEEELPERQQALDRTGLDC